MEINKKLQLNSNNGKHFAKKICIKKFDLILDDPPKTLENQKKKSIVINISETMYKIIREVSNKLNWKLSNDKSEE